MQADHSFFSNIKHFAALFVALLYVLILISCGGGGGGTAPAPEPPPAPATYSISGNISGGVVESVTINLTGTATASTTTDASGNFSFSGLPNGNYALNPSMPNYIFTPAVINVPINDANSSGHNFSSIGVVSGAVSGAMTAGVAVNLSGPTSVSTTTEANGDYRFEGLASGTYYVTPYASGYAFTPLSHTINFTGVADTGNNFVATVTGTHSVSGTVSGHIGANVTLHASITGIPGDIGTVVSKSDGSYEFRALTAGLEYTITPERSDYTFAPDHADIAILNDNSTGNDFTATSDKSDLVRYSVSGTVIYNGSQSGDIYIMLEYEGGYMSHYGTTIANASNGDHPYTIRGVPDASYRIIAWMDVLDYGAPNDANPIRKSPSAFSVAGGPVTLDIPLGDQAPPLPEMPNTVMAFPNDQGAIVLWDIPLSASRRFELADSYDIFWNTTTPVGPANNIGSATDIKPFGDEMGHYMVTGLDNGQTHYFAVLAKVGAVESSVTESDPVTIGQPTGGYTISGEVTFPGATGPLYVLVMDFTSSQPVIYSRRYDTPSSPQSFSISGIQNGTYNLIALLDMNDSGRIDLGDLEFNTEQSLEPVIISDANTVRNLILKADDALANVSTSHVFYAESSSEHYEVHPVLYTGVKRPIKVTLTGGPGGLNLPVDLSLRNRGGRFEGSFWDVPLPMPGDAYIYEVTYSDDITETLSGKVTALLDLPNPIAPEGNNVPGGTQPVFSWAAPTAPPPIYAYQLDVYSITGSTTVWATGNPIPPSETSVIYNFDGNASYGSLSSGDDYWWDLNVYDPNNNRAMVRTLFTPLP